VGTAVLALAALPPGEAPGLGSDDELGARLLDAAVLRAPLARSCDAYRFANDLGDQLPGVTLDRYGDFAVLAVASPEAEGRARFIAEFLVQNGARGVYLATSGPWDRWTILGIEPAASLARDAAGWRIISDLQIPPHDSRSIDLHIRADTPSEDQLTFAVREVESRTSVMAPGDVRRADATSGRNADRPSAHRVSARITPHAPMHLARRCWGPARGGRRTLFSGSRCLPANPDLRVETRRRYARCTGRGGPRMAE
jgi:hypothetical protein